MIFLLAIVVAILLACDRAPVTSYNFPHKTFDVEKLLKEEPQIAVHPRKPCAVIYS